MQSKLRSFIFDALKHPKFIELKIDKINGNIKKPDKNYFEQFFDYIGTRLQAYKSLNSLSYFDENVTNEIYEIIPDTSIEDLKIKYSAVATDLLSGEELILQKEI